jgi:hypothetical protein
MQEEAARLGGVKGESRRGSGTTVELVTQERQA